MTIRERLGGARGRPRHLPRRRQQRLPLADAARGALRDALHRRLPGRLRAAAERSSRPAASRRRRERRHRSSVDDRPARRRPTAPTCSTPTSGRAWARRRSASSGSATSSASASTASCSSVASRTRSRCTACPPTSARRSPRTCSTAPRSLVWDQAENRLHTQKAVMALTVPLTCGSTTSSRRRSTRCPPTSRPRCATSRSSSRTSTRDDPDLYGLYEGIPLTEGGDMAGELPEPDHDLPASRSRTSSPTPDELERRDPDHRAPRARPLLRPRRGPPRGARVRVTTLLRDRHLGRVRRRRGRRRCVSVRAPRLTMECRGMSGRRSRCTEHEHHREHP